ncbi:alpha/beta hydrolase family protein [Calidifontibacter terrae]
MKTRHIAGAAAAGALAGGFGATGLAAYFARKVVTPEPPADDITVLEFSDLTVTLSANDETTAPGRYGLWSTGFDTHVRLGDVLLADRRRVTRELLGVDFGELTTGPARLNGSFYAGPPATALGIDLEQITYEGPMGAMPAWQMRVPDATRWAVLVHGRGANRTECLRALPTLRDAGINALVISYRNDPEAPQGGDGRYNLGLTEWLDVEAAMAHAIAEGASDLQLFGWSMGGAAVLQVMDRSALKDHVSRVVLDSPVINWRNVLAFQAGLNRVPALVGRMGQSLMRGPLHRGVIGLHEPIDLTRADWVRRADELNVPILLIHSADDDFVPFGPSAELAAARPDIVRLEQFSVARHCRSWNVDSQRWERAVRSFCAPQVVP